MVVDQAGTKVRECDLSMFTGPTNRRRRQSATDCDRRAALRSRRRALFGHLVLTVGTTDMPGPSSTSGGSSNRIFTGTRCTILTKLPVGFSAGRQLNGA